ncbi:nicotinate-nucleotide pyrophosphorylase [Bradyrhizobium sp. GM22.5]
MRICCTRKTTPGLRALEKYAVRCGGGFNHRFGLDDAILIKDNHIAVAGGIRPVLERARAQAGHLVKIEIEVDTLPQLREVLDTGLADAVLLDNMDIATLREAVRLNEGRLKLEASGGVTLDSIPAIAATGSRLRLIRRADAFGAKFRLRAGYRGVRRYRRSVAPISAELLAC